jgi:hypothetical protein
MVYKTFLPVNRNITMKSKYWFFTMKNIVFIFTYIKRVVLGNLTN